MSNIIIQQEGIPYICHFFYTHTFSGLKILHSKVRKFATKIASRQNSVNDKGTRQKLLSGFFPLSPLS